MKYIKLFEAFSKDYMKKIELKDFKKIKKGTKLMYMGGKVEVLDNNGYVLKLKGDDDRIFMVNKSQFDHGGMTMRETANEFKVHMMYDPETGDEYKAEKPEDHERMAKLGYVHEKPEKVDEGKIELALNKIEKWMPEDQDVQQEYYDIIDKGNVKGMEEFLDIHADEEVLKTFGIKYKDLGKLAKAAIKESVVNEGSDQQRLTHLRKFGIAPNNQPQNGAYIKSVSKPGKFFVDWKDAFGLGDVALEFVKSVGSISEFDIIDLKTMKRTGKQLDVKKGQLGNLRTTYGVRVNESSAKDGGDKSNGNSHHEDHKSNSIAQHWKDTYGEDFHSKYPAIAKIVKSRPGLDKRELKRIWDETYGENFEEQYPALWQKMD